MQELTSSQPQPHLIKMFGELWPKDYVLNTSKPGRLLRQFTGFYLRERTRQSLHKRYEVRFVLCG